VLLTYNNNIQIISSFNYKELKNGCFTYVVKVENKPRITNKERVHQKDYRKINGTCLSRMYVNNFEDGHVEVECILTSNIYYADGTWTGKSI